MQGCGSRSMISSALSASRPLTPFTSGTALNLSATFDAQNAPTLGTRVIRAVLKGSTTTTKGRVVYAPIQQGYQSVNIPFP
jgi:hypothetical protein